MERSAGAKTNQTQKDRNPAQAGFRVIPDYKALAISRVGHGYHRKDLSQILKRSYFYPSIVATAQPSPPSALDIAYAVHVVSQFVSASTVHVAALAHSLGNSAEDHTGHRIIGRHFFHSIKKGTSGRLLQLQAGGPWIKISGSPSLFNFAVCYY
ncbi:hypothetical protein Tco_1382621 [Tanacetum coccineum]